MPYASYTAPRAAAPLIRVRKLTVTYAAGEQPAAALREIDFDIARAEIVGVLGESGSGKSTLALSILGLLPANATVQGSILLQKLSRNQNQPGEHLPDEGLPDEELQSDDLLRLDERRCRAIRGARISMVFQEPALSLSPVMRVGDQIAEVLRAHRRGKTSQHKQDVAAILRRARLLDTDRVFNAYPHQLSGGELHRVAIAQALACGPNLMIADEPTRSLDVTVQAEIISVLRTVNRECGTALVFITHNPALLAGFADRVIVIYAGRIVEEGPVSQVFGRPLHPYTRGLLQLTPRASEYASVNSKRRLPVIPGQLGNSDRLASGCAFEPRCPARTLACRQDSPGAVTPEHGRRVSCFNYDN